MSLLPTRALGMSQLSPPGHSTVWVSNFFSPSEVKAPQQPCPSLAFTPLVLMSLSLEIPHKPRNWKTFLMVYWLSDCSKKGKPVFFHSGVFSLTLL